SFLLNPDAREICGGSFPVTTEDRQGLSFRLSHLSCCRPFAKTFPQSMQVVSHRTGNLNDKLMVQWECPGHVYLWSVMHFDLGHLYAERRRGDRIARILKGGGFSLHHLDERFVGHESSRCCRASIAGTFHDTFLSKKGEKRPAGTATLRP